MSEKTARPNFVLILIGLAIAFALPELPIKQFLAPQTTLDGMLQREAFFWGVAILLLLYVLVVERRRLSSIGFRRLTWKSVVFGILAGIVMVAGFVFIIAVVFPALHLAPNTGAMQTIMQTPLWFRVLLVLRAAVFEEIAFRGYPIERLTELTGSKWLAALLAVAAFTVAHAGYWGWDQLIIPAFGGVVLTALYLWRRDLGSNMIAHFVADGAGFLFGGAG